MAQEINISQYVGHAYKGIQVSRSDLQRFCELLKVFWIFETSAVRKTNEHALLDRRLDNRFFTHLMNRLDAGKSKAQLRNMNSGNLLKSLRIKKESAEVSSLKA